VIVELFSSTLPADVLYGENGLPRADSEPAQSSSAAATVSAPKVGGRDGRAAIPLKTLGMS
jgi:hypothetical protein